MLKLYSQRSKRQLKKSRVEVFNVKYKPCTYCVKAKSLGKVGVFSRGLKLISHWWKLSSDNLGPKKMCKYQTGLLLVQRVIHILMYRNCEGFSRKG